MLKETALTIRSASISKVGGFSFTDGNKRDQKELGVGKSDGRVEESHRSENVYPEANLFSGGAICWLRLCWWKERSLSKSLVNKCFVLGDQRWQAFQFNHL